MSSRLKLSDSLGKAMAGGSGTPGTSGAKKVGQTSINVPGKSTKPKKDTKTYVFELELGESNEDVYPEFSWADLVRKEKAREAAEKAKKAEEKGPSGPNRPLDPYASDDDEDDLKAMAERFEKKYGNSVAGLSKKNRREEDFIDRGAGYDVSDSFIDNTDAYDEIVPQDLQTVHGGFYINSGKLDFKEVEVSEDDDEESVNMKKITKTDHPIRKGPKIKFGKSHPSITKRKNSTDSPATGMAPGRTRTPAIKLKKRS